MPSLSARQLSLSYDTIPIIDSLDVELFAGKMTALVGPNGCGKSTLLRGLARLLKPKQGAVFLDGKALAQLPTREIARQLGLLPQSSVPPEGITVRELVAQGRYPHQRWFDQWSEQDEAHVARALELTELELLANRAVDTLSGGQRQRAWIAMTLAQDTEILLLDEPTTFLDLAHQVEVLDLLSLLNEEGKTIVMVLHDLNQAARYAHQLIALKGGKIYANGAPTTVLTETLVRQVFGVECRIVPHPVTNSPLVVPLGRLSSHHNHSSNGHGQQDQAPQEPVSKEQPHV